MTILWILLAAFIAACALGVVLSRSPITSAISLLVGFVGVGVLYLCLKAEFVAAVQVFVYAGGIMVLYVIGVMFTDSEALRLNRQTHMQAWPAFFLVLLLFLWMGHKLYHAEYKAVPSAITIAVATSPEDEARTKQALEAKAALARDTNPRQVSVALFSDYLYPFEAASVLLTVAVLGGIFLAKKEV
ncbi:MAG: NADH-quinone oxidoreductase subunit J [Acidobacteria bacterium]|jgi:NADH-quinone oxidoreductase subunit J|nr:NADH-quinone oxidoreductase subunit J [Acidobacteriota bacterium]